MRVGGDQLLIARILLPGNVPRMVIAKQHRPLRLRLAMSCGLPCTAIHHLRPSLRLPEGVSPRVCGVRQDLEDCVVDRDFPHHLRFTGVTWQCWETDLLLAKPQKNLANTTQ